MTIEADIQQLTELIDAMLADISGVNIVEAPKVMDFMLDARIIASRMADELKEPVAV